MYKVIIYSTHNYTASIANRLKEKDVYYKESLSEDDFLHALSEQPYDLIILDSTDEAKIFNLVEKFNHFDLNKLASILFLIPGKISYKQEMTYVDQRSILGISKPFSPKEFVNITQFLMQKKKHQDQVNAAFVELQHFTVMASHDLKTPMKNIYAYTDILIEDLEELAIDNHDDILHSISVIQNESKRMIQFVNDMFEFSNAGNLNLHAEAFNLKVLIENIYKMVLNDYSSRDISLKFNYLPSTFIGDQAKLTHIFQNLFENAMKYSCENSPLILKVGVLEGRAF